jgi:hypothetical protein
MSAVPPAANGLTIRTGLVGQSCADAMPGKRSAIEAISSRTKDVMEMSRIPKGSRV